MMPNKLLNEAPNKSDSGLKLVLAKAGVLGGFLGAFTEID